MNCTIKNSRILVGCIRITKRLMFILILTIFAFKFNNYIQAKTAQEIAKGAFPSVVMLVMEDSNGQPLSIGSGFFVRGDIIATNLHVIEGAVGGYAKIVGKKSKYDIEGYVAIDKKSDLILLKVKEAKGTPIDIGYSSKVDVGDEVFAVGNPRGLEGTFSKGIVSAVRKIDKDTILQITAPISPGSSGGPVINNEGSVIGIAVATYNDGQNLNFAIPISHISLMLKDSLIVKKLKVDATKEGKNKSILHGLGDKSTASVRHKHFEINFAGQFSFSLINQLKVPVKEITCIVIFYDSDKDPVDYEVVNYFRPIPPRLAKLVKGSTSSEVYDIIIKGKLNIPNNKLMDMLISEKLVEIRILNFITMEGNEVKIRDIF